MLSVLILGEYFINTKKIIRTHYFYSFSFIDRNKIHRPLKFQNKFINI